ncbi:hypothetical protein HPB51_019010 [Rhipicephalus microplus]|uniref:Uncharacterized protein n=1 Tax=Rhipicephalus microplus TaxID=6941 RepID=A0A9J6D6I9_RHIMP|nr:hypothetical protein HPB51_019010 [Rhipicephalus microplus]
MMTGMKDTPWQTLHVVNRAGEKQPLEDYCCTSKLEDELKNEDQATANVEKVKGSRTHDGSYGICDKIDHDEHVPVISQVMMSAKESADSLRTINNDQFGQLVTGASCPPMFPVVSSSLGAQVGHQNFILLSFGVPDNAVTKQGDGRLKTKVKMLFLPLKLKRRVLEKEQQRNRQCVYQPRKLLIKNITAEHRES